ncbi:MAG: amidohydrolase [Desulfotalea sp.]
MTTILLKHVTHNNKNVDILIKDGVFSKIEESIEESANKVLDCRNKAILPPYYNCHTHAGMTLLRGYADDYDLGTWLNEHIWPFEAKLRPDDIYAGARLACLEMIKSGTVFFADMYWADGGLQAATEMGLRASLGPVALDFPDQNLVLKQRHEGEQFFTKELAKGIIPTICPHAIYTVAQESLEWCVDLQKKHNAFIHTHISETAQEVADCKKKHGVSPVEYLNNIGLLGPKTIAAHCVHLSQHDMEILADTEVKIVHNPVSNLKLTAGIMDYAGLKRTGNHICLGTDGCSSNNNLDMGEEAKFASLLAKHQTSNPSTLPKNEIFNCATLNGAKAFGINSGEIAVGKEADCMLVDLNDCRLSPNHDLISNMIYSADSSCINTVICQGKILMENNIVANEEEIIEEAKRTCQDIASR